MTFLSTLTGSFSKPAADNPTVVMMEAAYRHHHLNARYINCEVAPENLKEAVLGAKAMGWVGFNCSIPHKVAVVQHLDELAESAHVIGAVNCVVHREGRLIGENTDGQGFLKSLKTAADPSGKHMVLFGAGGAARAIAVESALAGAQSITIVNRSSRQALELVHLLQEHTAANANFMAWDQAFTIPDKTDIVINATPIGLFPDTSAKLAFNQDSLQPHMIVADVIPNPPNTRFIQEARVRGCKTLDGLGMLVNQAVISIELWTGLKADARIMRQTLDDLFAAQVT